MIKFDEMFNPSCRLFFLLRMLIILLLGSAIYYQTFGYGFVFDDNLFIVNNPYIKDFKDVHGMWINFPITRLIGVYSFAFNYSVCQLKPQGYHIFNFLVHLLSTGLVWALTRTLFRATGRLSSDLRLREESAFIIALFFLVHPGQTQAVSYICQRYESIAAAFYLGSVLCYLKGRISTSITHQILLISGAVCFGLLGILTKETAATLPAMFLAIELILLKRNPFDLPKSPSWKLYLTLIVSGALFVLLFMKIVRTDFIFEYFHFSLPSESHDGDMITSGKYVLTQLRVFLTFCRLLILPVNQNLDYDYPLSTGLLNPPLTLIGLCLIAFIVFVIFRLRQQRPLIAFGLAWILITFSINTAPRINIIFEHKLYLISYGFFLSAVCALSEGIKDRKVLFGLLIILIAVLSLVSYKRNQVWKNDLTLWEDVVKKSPSKARPYNYLGMALSNNGDLPQAISAYTKAMELDPHLVESYNDRAGAYAKQGQFTQAIADYTKAIEVEPTLAVPYYNRGHLYLKSGKFNLAAKDFVKVIELKPKFISAYGDLGVILANQGQIAQAIAVFTKALDIDPNYAPAFYNRDKLYYQLKEYDKAWADVHKAEALGSIIEPGFLTMLKRDSGREE